jgi:hypothetical protein
MKGIVVCTTAGTTAEWWFNRTEVGHPTWQAFKRSCTTSLGAIAFGSFFVAIIQTACYVLNQVKTYIEKMPGAGTQVALVVKIATCCLKCLQKCVEIFNFYCYVVSQRATRGQRRRRRSRFPQAFCYFFSLFCLLRWR